MGARSWAEGQIENRARAELPPAASVSAHIRAFPFVPALLLAGKVSETAGHFRNVRAGGLTFSDVDVELHGVRINRGKLLHERAVELVDVDEGTVTVDIVVAQLGKAVGLGVVAANGQLKVTVAGVSATANLSVHDNALVVDVAGVVKRIPIPQTRLVPCATSASVLAGRVRLSCTIHDVPPGLLGAANRRLGQ